MLLRGLVSGCIFCYGSNIRTVNFKGLNLNSCQGDKVIMNILLKWCTPEINEKEIIFNRSRLKGITVDVSQCPDLVPHCSSEPQSRWVNIDN